MNWCLARSRDRLPVQELKKVKVFVAPVGQKRKTIIVPDVNAFPGHIACSSLSLSEIVVPLIKNGEVVGVLDVDSEKYADFNETDKIFLEELVTYLFAY